MCEFCGEDFEFEESTSFYSNYCKGCLKLVIRETKKALEKIREKEQAREVQEAQEEEG